MDNHLVYLGLGSNIGDSVDTIKKAIRAISDIPHAQLLKTSRHFLTTPVSDIPQADYINAVCKLQTPLPAEGLLHELQKIEIALGKRQKAKNAPREIDIDILFFGTARCETTQLQIPHPRWKERLFVLMPLWDVTEEITCPMDDKGSTETLRLEDFIRAFSNPHQERVTPLDS